MAEQPPERGFDLDQSQFCCPVCLDLLKEPVTIPCGHSYCKTCIEGCWEQEEQRGEVSCPQCRETFSPRPPLRRNNLLMEVVEKLKQSSPQQAPPPADVACAGPAAAACAGPADVACDFCCGTRIKATMSCLTCLASFCPAHLEPHHTVPVLKKHQVVSATMPLQEKMCEKHNKLLEIYCQKDKKCICYLCVLDEHKSHPTVSAAAERAEEQKQLAESRKKVQKLEKKREKELNELLQALQDFKSGFQPAVEDCDRTVEELISSIKTEHTLMKQLMEEQTQTAVTKAEELQLQLEEQISKLKKSDAELEQISLTDDHIHFIQVFQSTSCESDDESTGPVVHLQCSTFKPVTDCVKKLRDDMENLLKDARPVMSSTVSSINVVLPPVPKTRAEFLHYCRPLKLDENSVSQYFSISQENRQVTNQLLVCKRSHKTLIHSPAIVMQVLCREGLSERCYWEVTWNGGSWSVAVSYKHSNRTDLEFGHNNTSWSLECSQYGYDFRHNGTRKSVSVSGKVSSSIGVFLDYRSGTLSFYDVPDGMTLIHHVQVPEFTEPLYPGLGLMNARSCEGCSAELTKLW